ncbi:MAG TPA: sigma-70 family RNA polymerase sigma factor [Patescibacteria group bacterium]|nr:sigma-70 family RNA polymerase sigma factor [Patescibacteria group bacterium]
MNDVKFAFNLDLFDCVARVRLQDQDAARYLVEYLYPFVRSIVRRRLPRGVAEEDLMQEIFAKMFEKLDQYRGEVPFKHWVSRIAVNRCLNALRAQKARPEWRMADLSEELQASLDSTSVEQQHPACALGARELVERMLEGLNPKDRFIVRMLDLEELSVKDVQQATGWSATYIRLRAFRARRKLNRRCARLRKAGSQAVQDFFPETFLAPQSLAGSAL